ncbi:MAG: class I SAM-dependent methyltransferase [Bacteroidota bacterium]
MPTIKENLKQWSSYDWSEGGDEWSKPWGDSDTMWYGTIYPRIRAVAESNHILEIAPGYGRCTKHLLKMCKKLTVVDLAEKCIDACKKRFSSCNHIRYFVNDGKSLKFLDDNSIDFVFSWDSLVHANDEVFVTYLTQLAKKMKPGGYGFIHHSNMGSYRDEASGFMTAASHHWRDTTMSAKLFRETCAKVGLHCVSQEIIQWEPGILSDTFSLFTRLIEPRNVETKIFENHQFMNEVENLRRIRENSDPAVSRR